MQMDHRIFSCMHCDGIVGECCAGFLFIFCFGWGIRGAAWATFLAETVSAVIVLWYLRYRFQAFDLSLKDFRPNGKLYLKMAAIGAGPAFNFGTQAIVQIFLNNALRMYGAASVYGSDICLAVAGVASKVNTLASAMIVGLTNGLQPIASYNYGKKTMCGWQRQPKKSWGWSLHWDGWCFSVISCFQCRSHLFWSRKCFVL